MPQLVKGGKYVYGWSRVSTEGTIRVPEEARKEYGFQPHEKLFITNSSRTSRGFVITSIRLIQDSILFNKIAAIKELVEFQQLPHGYVSDGNRIYTWTEMSAVGSVQIPEKVLKLFDVQPEDYLLSVRGSGFALGMLKTGPIIEEARKHQELEVFE